MKTETTVDYAIGYTNATLKIQTLEKKLTLLEQRLSNERVNLVSEIASRLYGSRLPGGIEVIVHESIAIVEATEKLCKETKTKHENTD